jgi:hypothetical protein
MSTKARRTSSRNKASSSSKAPDQASTSSDSSTPNQADSSQESLLQLLIFTHQFGVYAPPQPITSDELARSAMTPGPPDLNSPGFTYLLSGPLDEFVLYSDEERSQWLIDIAHDICDPLLKRGTLKKQIAGGRWRRVDPTHRLTASTYLYDIPHVVSLTKISERVGHSRTSITGNPSTMRNRVMQRDGGRCWVNGDSRPVVNSHVCPKRIDDHILRFIYDTFESNPRSPTLSIYDEMCGITLFQALDPYFDKYDFGLRAMGPVHISFSLVVSS